MHDARTNVYEYKPHTKFFVKLMLFKAQKKKKNPALWVPYLHLTDEKIEPSRNEAIYIPDKQLIL